MKCPTVNKGSLKILTLVITFLITGCGDSLKGGKVSALHISETNGNFQVDSQVAHNTQHSTDFQIIQANAGGSYFKKKVASRHFQVSGGVANGVL